MAKKKISDLPSDSKEEKKKNTTKKAAVKTESKAAKKTAAVKSGAKSKKGEPIDSTSMDNTNSVGSTLEALADMGVGGNKDVKKAALADMKDFLDSTMQNLDPYQKVMKPVGEDIHPQHFTITPKVATYTETSPSRVFQDVVNAAIYEDARFRLSKGPWLNEIDLSRSERGTFEKGLPIKLSFETEVGPQSAYFQLERGSNMVWITPAKIVNKAYCRLLQGMNAITSADENLKFLSNGKPKTFRSELGEFSARIDLRCSGGIDAEWGGIPQEWQKLPGIASLDYVDRAMGKVTEIDQTLYDRFSQLRAVSPESSVCAVVRDDVGYYFFGKDAEIVSKTLDLPCHELKDKNGDIVKGVNFPISEFNDNAFALHKQGIEVSAAELGSKVFLTNMYGDQFSDLSIVPSYKNDGGWVVTANMNGNRLHTIHMVTKDAEKYLSGQMSDIEVISRCYPSKLAPRLSADELANKQLAGGETIQKVSFYQPQAGQPFYPNWVFYAQIDGKQYRAPADYFDRCAFYDKTASASMLCEKMFGQELGKERELKANFPNVLKESGGSVEISTNREWMLRVNMGSESTKWVKLEKEDVQNLKNHKTTRAELAVKKQWDDISKLLSKQTPGLSASQSLKR